MGFGTPKALAEGLVDWPLTSDNGATTEDYGRVLVLDRATNIAMADSEPPLHGVTVVV